MSFNKLNQPITYWAPTGPDGSGGFTWANPTQIYGRWENRSEEVHSPTGELIVSRSVVFLSIDVEVHGYLYEGQSIASNPVSVEGAQRIFAYVKTPNLRNMKYERRAYTK